MNGDEKMRSEDLAAAVEGAEALREALEDMCHQFAYDTDGPGLSTGGLSALEAAFALLGWDDPHLIPEATCDEPGCSKRATSGLPTPVGYRRVCGVHWAALRATQARAEGEGE